MYNINCISSYICGHYLLRFSLKRNVEWRDVGRCHEKHEAARPETSAIYNYISGFRKLINLEPEKLISRTPGDA